MQSIFDEVPDLLIVVDRNYNIRVMIITPYKIRKKSRVENSSL